MAQNQKRNVRLVFSSAENFSWAYAITFLSVRPSICPPWHKLKPLDRSLPKLFCGHLRALSKTVFFRLVIWPLTFDFWAKVHFYHYNQCKLLLAPAEKFEDLLPNNLHQIIAHVKHFQLLWTFWPWPHSQGHRSHMYVWKWYLKTWHISSLVGLEVQYLACRLTYNRSTCCMKTRSVWPQYRCWGVLSSRIGNALELPKTCHRS